MRARSVFALVVLLAGLGLAGPSEGRAVTVEVATSTGRSLGRLDGEVDGATTYFRLQDVVRVVGGTVRVQQGRQATWRLRGKTILVRKDQAGVQVGGQALTLAAPVRVRQKRWVVPGDLLVRILPAALGTGVRVTSVPPGRPAPGPGATVASAPERPAGAGTPVVATFPPPETTLPAVPLPPGPTPPPAPRVSGGGASSGEAPREGPPPPAEAAPASRPAPPRPASPDEPTIAAPLDGPTRLGTTTGPIEIRHRSYPTYTRIVVEAPRPLEPRLVEQRDGLLVTLGGWAGSLPRTTRIVRDGLVAEVELSEGRNGPALHVSFERPPAGRKIYRLTDPPRLVLDVARVAPGSGGRAPVEPGGLRTIVIDPGHGGHDPGAIGPGGLQEKDVTLDLARRVAGLLQEDHGVRVVLTRSQDRFIALRARTALANKEKADLFVSIHLNSAPGMTAGGTETYFLSSEATDNAARAAAAFENRVISVEAGSGGASRDVLRSILWDLTQSDFQQESSRLAEALQLQLDRGLRLPSRGIKQAPFYVLGGAAMPAVLVEVGFLSNPQEEQRLRDEGYRDRIARALAAGLGAYKREYEQRAAGGGRP